jgi:inhibitor of KinA sporulation pathway (predicted exonuclease)
MDLIVVIEDPREEITRSVTLTNDQWLILSQCVESFSDAYRKQHSQTIATYVTRGQLDQAQVEARKMNDLLQTLDKLQAKLV